MKHINYKKAVALGLGALLALAGVSSALRLKPSMPSNDMDYEVELPVEEDEMQLTFAEMGASFEPRTVTDHEGKSVVSFLQASPKSNGVAHDSVVISKDATKYDILGKVAGLENKDPVTVILGTAMGSRFDILLEQKVSKENPNFKFQAPKGKYYVKVEGSGYLLPGVHPIKLPCQQAKCPFSKQDDEITVQKIDGQPGIYKYEWVLQKDAPYGVESLSVVDLVDASVINAGKAGIEDHLDYSDAAAKLKMNYGIELHGAWGAEYASRILGILDKWTWLKEYQKVKPTKQKWILTDQSLYPQDVEIVHVLGGKGTAQTGSTGHQPTQATFLENYNRTSYQPPNHSQVKETTTYIRATDGSGKMYRVRSHEPIRLYRRPTGQTSNPKYRSKQPRSSNQQNQRGQRYQQNPQRSSHQQNQRGQQYQQNQQFRQNLQQQHNQQNQNGQNMNGNGGGQLKRNHDENEGYDQVVTISRLAFMYAARHTIENKAQRGVYFSRRLHKAIIRALFLHNPTMMRSHFLNMHDVKVLEPGELDVLKRQGINITKYPSGDYQSWFLHPEELVEIATSWQEYPIGMQKIKGLKYLIRRVNGTVNPDEPTAAAIAYPRGPNIDSHIEFMEVAFSNYGEVPNLILHELGHFIDINLTPANIRRKWEEVGGWYKDNNDPDGWSTSKQTEFVSAYSHKKNPSEDFACSISDYVLNPKLLMSRAPNKFQFIRENIMNGAYYVTKASHEFLVLNLGNPDFMYPGRIIRIKLQVTGNVHEDKKIEFLIELANNGENSCAVHAGFRLTSSTGTYIDVSMKATSCSHILTGSIVMDKSQKRGVWTTDQITLVDQNVLNRYVAGSEFGMRVWLDNGAEDFQEPKAITPSIALSLLKEKGYSFIRATWMVADDGKMRERGGAFASINSPVTGQHSLSEYSHLAINPPQLGPNWRNELWSGHRQIPTQMCDASMFTHRQNSAGVIFNQHRFSEDEEYNGLTRRQVESNSFNCYQVSVNIPISSAARSGPYYLSMIMTYDAAGNSQTLRWPNERGPTVYFQSNKRPDNSLPEIKDVSVKSHPVNERNPNGETVVNIAFNLRDTDSGIAYIQAVLVDPFGAKHYIHPSFYAQKGWQLISYKHILPRGSIPGVWHMSEIRAEDNAGNELVARLTEQILVSG